MSDIDIAESIQWAEGFADENEYTARRCAPNSPQEFQFKTRGAHLRNIINGVLRAERDVKTALGLLEKRTKECEDLRARVAELKAAKEGSSNG